MMNNSCGVVVWCYYGSRRKPIQSVFDPTISNTIEANYISYFHPSNSRSTRPSSYPPNPNHSSRFPVDPNKSSQWAQWEIELQTFTVENKTTGNIHQICRHICVPESVFSQGYEWVVEGDTPRQWIAYDFDSSQLIEDAFSSRKSNSFSLDLSKTASGLPYKIDLKGKTLTQTNIRTGKKRKMKRQQLPSPYTSMPLSSVAATGNYTNGGGTTACQGIKRLKVDISKTGASLQKSASNCQSTSAPINVSPSVSRLSSAVPLSQSLSSVEQVTEPLPNERSIKISRDDKARDNKNAIGIEKYMTAVTAASEMDSDCIICMEKLSEESSFGEGGDQARDVVKLATCEHTFHKLCLLAMYENDHKKDCLECPSCKTIYGEKCGNCPPGEMLWEIRKGIRIPGYEGYNAIRLIYFISPGVQGPGDPNPGARYQTVGFPREGYLPDCNKGRKVLKLLIEAFKRKLMFTIGTSVTTGQTDTVTWNEIHLKTEPTSNRSGHGYPDPLYLDNVLMELASHGVKEKTCETTV